MIYEKYNGMIYGEKNRLIFQQKKENQNRNEDVSSTFSSMYCSKSKKGQEIDRVRNV